MSRNIKESKGPSSVALTLLFNQSFRNCINLYNPWGFSHGI